MGTVEDLRSRIKQYRHTGYKTIQISALELQFLYQNTTLAQWARERDATDILSDPNAIAVIDNCLVLTTEKPANESMLDMALASAAARMS